MKMPPRLRDSLRPTSLAGKLGVLVSTLVVSVVVGGLVLFCALAYRVQIKERRDNLQAIAATVAKLVARPVSLGDYALVEVYLSDKDMPPFIRALSVSNPEGELLAGYERSAGPGTPAAGELTGTVTVPIATAGSAEGGAPSLTVKASFQDIREEAVAMTGTAVGIGILLVLGIMFVSRLSLRWALGPLKAAVDMGASTPDLDAAVAERAPDEIKPLLIRVSDLYKESSRLEAAGKVGALASQVAHDIRSPLASLEVAARDASQLPKTSRALITGAIERIREIADDLLDESRAALEGTPSGGAPRAGEPASACLLSGLIEPLVSEKRLAFRDREGVVIEASLGASSPGPCARLQPGVFRRVLSNLINNAVEALGPSGGLVSLSLSSAVDEVSIEITDDGKGIQPEVLAKLGRRGETHGKEGGSGLGLHHARTSVESWGGRLELRSEPGRGTTVAIVLPKAPPADGWDAVLIDDDPLVRRTWEIAARRAGKKLKAYERAKEFFADEGRIARSVPVYIDARLGDEESGERESLRIRELGFSEVYLATGEDSARLPELEHLSGVVGKAPPWD